MQSLNYGGFVYEDTFTVLKYSQILTTKYLIITEPKHLILNIYSLS